MASVVGNPVSNRDVFTPPIVPLRGDVEAEEGGDLEPELAVSVEYGDVDFFSGIVPKVPTDWPAPFSPFCAYEEPFCA